MGGINTTPTLNGRTVPPAEQQRSSEATPAERPGAQATAEGAPRRAAAPQDRGNTVPERNPSTEPTAAPTARVEPARGTGSAPATDTIERSSNPALRTADPLDNTAVRGVADPNSASARAADEASKPSTFRKVLEVAEFFGRWMSSWMNLFSAAMSIFRLAFDPPDSGTDLLQRMARIGVDMVGVLMPPAAAIGHLALNAWWGADNPSDTELLAGYDTYLGKVPYIGELAGDQEHQDVWLGSWVRKLFREASERIRDFANDSVENVAKLEARPGYRDVGVSSSAALQF